MAAIRSFYPVLTFCFVLLAHVLFAQKKDVISEDTRLYSNAEYELSLRHYASVIAKDSTAAQARYFAGICLVQLGQIQQAKQYFESVNPQQLSRKKAFYYWKGVAALMNGEIGAAESALNKQKTLYPNVFQKQTARLRSSIDNAKAYSRKASIGYVENLGGQINTLYSEYSAVLTADHRGILYTTQRDDNRSLMGTGEIMEDILVSNLTETDQWETPKRLKRLTTLGHDATVHLFDNDQKMVLYHNEDLYVSEYANDHWSKPVPLPKHVNSPNTRETHMAFSPDGQWMIFTSNMSSKYGDLDLFLCRREADGTWGKPRFVEELNSDFEEDAPFFAEDGQLYFASNGPASMGGFDIFASMFDPKSGYFKRPLNLGLPINSVADDIFFTKKGSIAYLTSNRIGGYGGDDIYRVYLMKDLMLAGQVTNLAGELGEYTLEFVINDQVLTTQTVDGNYSIQIPIPSTVIARVIMDGRVILETSFDSKVSLQHPEKQQKDFVVDYRPITELPMIASIGTKMLSQEAAAPAPVVSLPTTFFLKGSVMEIGTGSALEATVVVIDEETGRTVAEVATENGGFALEVPYGKSYAIHAKKPGFESEEENVKAVIGSTGIVSVRMDKLGVKTILDETMVFFEFDKAQLTAKGQEELAKMIAQCQENPLLTLEMSGHTDKIGSKEYNLLLSNRRVQSVRDYLLAQGISPNQMVKMVGYGAENPIASNDYEVNGRERNRRVEIRVVRK